MEKKLPIKEIASMFGVTETGVRIWIRKGLPYDIEKVIGIKPRMIIAPSSVKEYLHNTKLTAIRKMDDTVTGFTYKNYSDKK